MSRPAFEYARAPGAHHGPMICAGCNKPIESGLYRIREKPDRFVLHHRACCESDAGWVALDDRNRQLAEANAALLAASIAFRDQWQIDDLDGLIDSLTPEPSDDR